MIRPDGTARCIKLAKVEQDVFETEITASIAGIYRIPVYGERIELAGYPFKREETVTGAGWKGGNQPPPLSIGLGSGCCDEILCKLLKRIIGKGAISADLEKKLLRWGYDPEVVRYCIERVCAEKPTLRIKEGPNK